MANYGKQYWGWCKQRYRDVPKTRFDEAKRVAHESLDACPVEVIWRFFNRSWRFMHAYRVGLTGKAADVAGEARAIAYTSKHTHKSSSARPKTQL